VKPAYRPSRICWHSIVSPSPRTRGGDGRRQRCGAGDDGCISRSDCHTDGVHMFCDTRATHCNCEHKVQGAVVGSASNAWMSADSTGALMSAAGSRATLALTLLSPHRPLGPQRRHLISTPCAATPFQQRVRDVQRGRVSRRRRRRTVRGQAVACADACVRRRRGANHHAEACTPLSAGAHSTRVVMPAAGCDDASASASRCKPARRTGWPLRAQQRVIMLNAPLAAERVRQRDDEGLAPAELSGGS
jgi:hypothetical protein